MRSERTERTPKAEKSDGIFLNSIAFKKLQNIFKFTRKTCGVNARKWPSMKEFLELSDSRNIFVDYKFF